MTGLSATKDYRGDVSPAEAWQVLTEDPKAVLVDVRTDAEWNYVGVPDLSSIRKESIFLSWQFFPTGNQNMQFVQELSARVTDQSATLLFLCRSGVRSKAAAAAMTRAGYGDSFNVLEGFEGDPDSQKHRGTSSGWKTAALPWIQG